MVDKFANKFSKQLKDKTWLVENYKKVDRLDEEKQSMIWMQVQLFSGKIVYELPCSVLQLLTWSISGNDFKTFFTIIKNDLISFGHLNRFFISFFPFQLQISKTTSWFKCTSSMSKQTFRGLSCMFSQKVLSNPKKYVHK